MIATQQKPRDPTGFLDAAGTEWIPAPRAAALIPSPTGRKTHLNSVRRWVADHTLRGKRMIRNGREYLWVALDDVLAMRELRDMPERRPAEQRPAKRNARLEAFFGGKRKGRG